MADIDIRRVHHLGPEKARRAADRMAGDLGRKFGLQGEWDGHILHFQRPGVTGALSVDGEALRLTVSLGLLLKAMKGSIERAVHEELDRLFPVEAARARTGKPAGPKPAPRGEKAGSRRKKAG